MWSLFNQKSKIRSQKSEMRFFNYALLVSGFCFLVSACGFSPVYKQSNTVAPQFQSIDIALIPDREGQYLRNELIDVLNANGEAVNARYKLLVDPIQERQVDLDITRASAATRTQLRLNSAMRLQDMQTGEIVLTRPLQVVTSTNILASEFANRVSESDARFNALDEMADQIQRHLALYFKSN